MGWWVGGLVGWWGEARVRSLRVDFADFRTSKYDIDL